MSAFPTLSAKLERLDSRLFLLQSSAVVVLLNAHDYTGLLVIGVIFCAITLRSPRLIRSPWAWLAFAAACFAFDLAHWRTLDDHIGLSHYWAFAVGCSLFGSDPAASLERNARLLIGLTFAFAVTSKMAWGEFIDGSMFSGIVLTDDRFSWVASFAGVDDPSANHEAYLGAVAATGDVPLQSGSRLGAVVGALTYGTFVIEGSLAVAFLAPLRGAWRWLRTITMTVFCIATYSLVPVAGFGSILLVMASSERRFDSRGRALHVAGAVVLVGWGVVWSVLH